MNVILISPLVAGILAQVVKFVVKSNKQDFSLKNLLGYSGMPSGHTSMVVALASITALELGVDSPIFAVSVILAVVVIRDALGIRRYMGRHGRTLNILIKDLGQDKMLDEEYPHLLEHVGHTPAQVIVGGLIGLGISIVFFLV